MHIKKGLIYLMSQIKKILPRIRLKYDFFINLITVEKYCLPFEKECIKKYTVKQIILIFFYKIKQFFLIQKNIVKRKILSILHSPFFYICTLFLLLFFLHRLNLEISMRDMKELSYIFSGIIGSSIAIIFSFSLFSLQNSADLFSSQYLKRFIDNKKEKIFFWILVSLATFILLLPYILILYILEISILLFVTSFYFIYILFDDLKKRVNPETTLKKISEDSISVIQRTKKKFQNQSDIVLKIHNYDEEEGKLNLDIQYKLNVNWNLIVKENIKQLYEIGLRLLSKNEINSFNLSVKYIHDIYIEHLRVRNGFFIRLPYDFLGTYTVDDEGLTTYILEYLQSISERLLLEKRKENIYYLIKIYENILVNSLDVKYADDSFHTESNPLASLIFNYHIIFLEKVINSNDSDWIWEIIKSLSKVSNTISPKSNNNFLNQKIYEILNKITLYSIKEKKETHLQELVNIYFFKINISWNKEMYGDVYWNELFKELKKGIVSLAYIERQFSMSISNIFSNFNTWKTNLINDTLAIKNEDEKRESIDSYNHLLMRWSNFLLDLARDTGLNNKQTGLAIIQAVDNNINIISAIKSSTKDLELEKLYARQFSILSWYFREADVIDESFLFNLEQVLEILIREIRNNLNSKIFAIDKLTSLYIKLIKEHIEKTIDESEYNHPRIIIKLIYLGLLFHKYEKSDQVEIIVQKINDFNTNYQINNKKLFEYKESSGISSGSDKFQLCKEIHDLKSELFSYGSSQLLDTKYILKQEIDKKTWDSFIEKIKFCKDIEYTTSHFPF